jgi:hypothetical protein
MPTINEVWEQALQINANLVTVHDDLEGLTQQANETNDWLQELRQLVADGFASIAAGVSAVHARQDRTNELMFLLVRQQHTIICALEKISSNTCTLVNESVRQTGVQESLDESASALNYMFATDNAEAALSYARHQEERKHLEECCPPPEPETPCSYEPCPAPEPPADRSMEDYGGFRPKRSRVRRVKSQGPQ